MQKPLASALLLTPGPAPARKQYNPKAIAWGAPFWAHVASTDLAHWRWLPPALLPDTVDDLNGIWSGAATSACEFEMHELTGRGCSVCCSAAGLGQCPKRHVEWCCNKCVSHKHTAGVWCLATRCAAPQPLVLAAGLCSFIHTFLTHPVDDQGTPWLSYTAASTHVPELGNFFQVPCGSGAKNWLFIRHCEYKALAALTALSLTPSPSPSPMHSQTQALASPANLSDPYLRGWRKSPRNPVLLQTPPGGTNFQVGAAGGPLMLGLQSALAATGLGGAKACLLLQQCGQPAASSSTRPPSLSLTLPHSLYSPRAHQFRDTTPANTDVKAVITAALNQRAAAAAANASAGAAAGNASVEAPRFAWAVGTQAFCLGTAALYTAPAIEGPWTFAGNLFNQLALDDKVGVRAQPAQQLIQLPTHAYAAVHVQSGGRHPASSCRKILNAYSNLAPAAQRPVRGATETGADGGRRRRRARRRDAGAAACVWRALLAVWVKVPNVGGHRLYYRCDPVYGIYFVLQLVALRPSLLGRQLAAVLLGGERTQGLNCCCTQQVPPQITRALACILTRTHAHTGACTHPQLARALACLLTRNALAPPAVAPGVYVVKWSDQDRRRVPFSAEW